MNSRLLTLLLLINSISIGFAQNVFVPNTNRFSSLADWQEPTNWIDKSGNTTTYPTGTDIISIEYTNDIDSLVIDFNLDDVSTELSFQYLKYGSHLLVTENGTAKLKFIDVDAYLIHLLVYGNLHVKSDAIFVSTQILFEVNGTCTIDGDLTFQSAANNLYIHEEGELFIGGNLNSNNGGRSSYRNFGLLNIGGDYINKGGAVNYVGLNATTRIEGNQISMDGGGGSHEVYGALNIEQTSDLIGNETIFVAESGSLHIGGDIILSCWNTINVDINGKFSVDSQTSCIIRDASCSEYSTNYQMCKRVKSIDLPVEMSQFYGKVENGYNTLYWETLSEHNSDHFEVEYSTNQTDWITLDTIQGAGNINTTTKYSYIDTLSIGRFYRLKQVDFDNGFRYYGPIVLENNELNLKVKAYPNVVSEGILINLEVTGVIDNEKVTAYLVSTHGKIISETVLSVNIQGSFLSSYLVPSVPSSGIYILRVISHNAKADTKLLIH